MLTRRDIKRPVQTVVVNFIRQQKSISPKKYNRVYYRKSEQNSIFLSHFPTIKPAENSFFICSAQLIPSHMRVINHKPYEHLKIIAFHSRRTTRLTRWSISVSFFWFHIFWVDRPNMIVTPQAHWFDSEMINPNKSPVGGLLSPALSSAAW